MKKYKEKLPLLIFIVFTVLNYLLGILFAEANHLLGASSTVQLFLLSIGIANKTVALLAIIYGIAFWTFMITNCIIKWNKKRFIMFIGLLSTDILVSVILAIYKLCTENYTFINFVLVGIALRAFYALWVIIRYKTKDKRQL